MNTERLRGLLVAGCMIVCRVMAQTPDITHFCGELTWTNSNTSLYYRVEWAPTLTDSDAWHSTYATLTDIQSSSPTVTVSVPMFYRVCGSSNRTVHASPAPRTGQTPALPLNPAPGGSDGDLQRGVSWPIPRFTDPDDGTVMDNLTRLIWLKNANPCGTQTWDNALAYCNSLSSGVAGLTDGSVAGDWRLPSIMELLSLLAWQYYDPMLANTEGTGPWTEGQPFTGVQLAGYWSSTTYAQWTEGAWYLWMSTGSIYPAGKTEWCRVWPVRGGP